VRRHARSGSPYEESVGFSRGVRVGDVVHIAGTAPIWPDGSCDPDPEVQARRCLAIIVDALGQLGAAPSDVVRTRMFLVAAEDADAVGRAHRAVFGEAEPAATMVVVSGLIDARWRIEMEAEAIVTAAPDEDAST